MFAGRPPDRATRVIAGLGGIGIGTGRITTGIITPVCGFARFTPGHDVLDLV